MQVIPFKIMYDLSMVHHGKVMQHFLLIKHACTMHRFSCKLFHLKSCMKIMYDLWMMMHRKAMQDLSLLKHVSTMHVYLCKIFLWKSMHDSWMVFGGKVMHVIV